MPQVVLNQAGVRPVIRQGIATGMTQHVRMGTDREARFFTDGGEDVIKLLTAEGQSAMRDEQPVAVTAGYVFTDSEPGAQGTYLPWDERMNGGEAVLEAGDVNLATAEVDIGQAQAEDFGGTQAVDKGHKDETVVTLGVGSAGDGLKELKDLMRGEKLAFLHGEHTPVRNEKSDEYIRKN